MSSSTFTSPYVEPGPASSPHEAPQRQLEPLHPLRRSSPVLFRDFFDAMSDTATRRTATLPHPYLLRQDPLHNVNRALENANRAIQDAQEAFHQARRLRSESEAGRLRTDSETPNQLVDLTWTSPPPDNSPEGQSHYISETTHPHDSSHYRSRRLHALDQPVYGHHQLPPPHQPPPPHHVNVRFWNDMGRPSHTRLAPIRDFPLPTQSEIPPALEHEAIARQRENHTNWQRAQARNIERLRRQEEGQLHAQDQSPHSSQITMSPPSSSQSRPTTSRSNASAPHIEPDDDSSAIDEVDLTGVDDSGGISAVLAKQREDMILQQNQGTEAGRTPLTAYKCPVCMETPTDATSTACGHVFCHRCIIETLKWSSNQRRDDAHAVRKVRGVCPVCRKPLDSRDTAPAAGRGLIPLELKFMTKKRKRPEESAAVKGKGKENERAAKRERESTEEFWSTIIHEDDA